MQLLSVIICEQVDPTWPTPSWHVPVEGGLLLLRAAD